MCVWCVCLWCVCLWCVVCVFVVCVCVWCVFGVCVWCVCVCARVRARVYSCLSQHANSISLKPYYGVLCGLSVCLSVPYFSTLSHTRRDVLKTCTGHQTCDFSLQSLSEKFLIFRRMQRDIISLHGSSCKVMIFCVKFYCNLIFSTDFRKILTYQM